MENLIQEQIKNAFASHSLTEADAQKMVKIRAKCKELAEYIVENDLAGRELSTALTSLENVMFWANAGIARKSPLALIKLHMDEVAKLPVVEQKFKDCQLPGTVTYSVTLKYQEKLYKTVLHRNDKYGNGYDTDDSGFVELEFIKQS